MQNNIDASVNGPAGCPSPALCYDRSVTFGRGLMVHFRAVRPTDYCLVEEFMRSRTGDRFLRRHFSVPDKPLPKLIEEFVNVNFGQGAALIGVANEGGRERVLAAGRYFLTSALNRAEFSISVDEGCQWRGLGTYLLRALLEIAQSRGVAGFTAHIPCQNTPMIHLVRKCIDALDLTAEVELEDNFYHVSLLAPGGENACKQGLAIPKIGSARIV